MIKKAELDLKNKGKEEKKEASANKALPQTAAKKPTREGSTGGGIGSASVR